MNAREAIKVLLSQADRCQGGSDLHRAYYAAAEVEANKALADHLLDETLLEFEAQELYSKLAKPGAPQLSGVSLIAAIGAAYGEVATAANAKLAADTKSTK